MPSFVPSGHCCGMPYLWPKLIGMRVCLRFRNPEGWLSEWALWHRLFQVRKEIVPVGQYENYETPSPAKTIGRVEGFLFEVKMIITHTVTYWKI